MTCKLHFVIIPACLINFYDKLSKKNKRNCDNVWGGHFLLNIVGFSWWKELRMEILMDDY